MRRAVAIVALLLAGCGGSSGPHMSKAAYVKRGDAICARYTKAISRLGTPTKITQIGPFIGQALPVLQQTVRQLGRLAPPSDLESEYGKFMDAARGTVSRATALRSAAANADSNEVQRLLHEATAASAQRAALAHAAGLDACALS
jgi:hypothetical protein